MDNKMKGKSAYSNAEILALKKLIEQRQFASRLEQKKIRNEMRKIGFWGKDDWGIYNCQLSDFESLLTSGKIKIIP